MSRDDDDLRFGDITGGGEGSNQPLPARLVELFQAGLIGIVGLYVILKILETLVEFDIPFI